MAEASDANTSEPPYTPMPTFRALRALGVYALEKPAIFGVLAYLYVSAIGLLYNVVYSTRSTSMCCRSMRPGTSCFLDCEGPFFSSPQSV